MQQPYYLIRIKFTSNWYGFFFLIIVLIVPFYLLGSYLKELGEIVREIVGPFLQSCTE